jgi:hypothetical protein
MVKKYAVVLGLVVTLLALGATQASAQTVNAAVSFNFMAGGKEFPAGSYQIRFANGGASTLLLMKSTDTGAVAQVGFMTRLADIGAGSPTLVFDVEDGKHYLSELHIPNQDGFLIAGAPGEHKHEKVQARE